MKTRAISILSIIALFMVAMLVGGQVAQHLSSLEKNVLRTWQQKLTSAGQTKANNVASYLETQQKILQEINGDTTLQRFLRASQTTQVPTAPDITRALDDIANLKYSLNHTYLFDQDSQLVVRQSEARTLPLSIRENLSQAYDTGLEKYMFFTTFENKTWFIASRRIQAQNEFLGYSAFMIEASAAMDPLRNDVVKWRDIDFNLARRSGDDNVFIVDWQKDLPTAKKYNIDDIKIPLFSGTANTFQAVQLGNDKELLMFIASVPTFPFWQHISSFPTAEALANVRNTRLFYLIGLGVFLLFVFALMFRFMRRIIDPNLAVIPEKLTGQKQQNVSTNITEPHNAPPHHAAMMAQTHGHRPTQNSPQMASGAPPQYGTPQYGPSQYSNTSSNKSFAKKRRAPNIKSLKTAAHPKNLLASVTKAMPWQRRTLSDEEKARIQQKGPAQGQSKARAHAHPPSAQQTPPMTAGSAPTEEQVPPVTEPIPQAPAPQTPAEQHQQEIEEAQRKAEKAKVKQIHNCLENEKYRLYFQPIQATESKEKIMFETLLRLVDEKGELMQPGEFFPLAFKHGFVDQVDDMVIVASLRRHMEILTQGKKNMLSINLSYGAFNSLNFMDTFQEGLNSGKLKPELLNFELNSREIIEDKHAMKFITEMQKSGAKFSVDFFGEPEKTIKAAKKLKFNYIKVDCLKFDGLGEGDAKQVERFKQIVDASKKHSLPIIAEKIESKSVLWLCEKLEVPYVQGFYLAEPSPKLSLGW